MYTGWKLSKKLLLAFATFALAASACLRGNDLEAQDTFMQAYQYFQAGDRLEREMNPEAALEKYRSAERILRQLQAQAPQWQPVVVEYRLRKILEGIERAENLLLTTNRHRGTPQTASSFGDDLEGPLPTPEGYPSTATATAALPPSSSYLQYPAPAQQTYPQQNYQQYPSTYPPQQSVPPTAYPQGVAARLIELEKELAHTRNELRLAQRRNLELTEKIQSKEAETRAAYLAAEKTRVDVVELKAKLAQVEQQFENYKTDTEKQIQVAQQIQADAAPLIEELRNTQAELDASEEENVRLRRQIDRATAYITQADSQRQELVQARDEALALVAAGENTAREAARLAEENAALTKRLTEVESRIKEIESLGQDEALKQIAALQEEVASFREQLLKAQLQIEQKDTRIAELQKQLDQASGEVARLKLENTAPEESARLAEENELLRGIVMRQLKTQARREQARKLISEELARLEVKSQLIEDQLAALTSEPLQLSEREQTLFRTPMVALADDGASRAEISMAIAAKPSGKKKSAQTADNQALPEDMEPLITQARDYFVSKNYAESEKIYEKILKENPDNYFALVNLAITQIQLNKLSAAAVALKKAIAVNGGDSLAYRSLGIVYQKQHKTAEAIEALEKAIAINPDDHIALNYLGILRGESGDRTTAQKLLEKAVSLQPEYADGHFNLAVLYATEHPPSKEAARTHYDKATALGAPRDASLEQLIQ